MLAVMSCSPLILPLSCSCLIYLCLVVVYIVFHVSLVMLAVMSCSPLIGNLPLSCSCLLYCIPCFSCYAGCYVMFIGNLPLSCSCLLYFIPCFSCYAGCYCSPLIVIYLCLVVVYYIVFHVSLVMLAVMSCSPLIGNLPLSCSCLLYCIPCFSCYAGCYVMFPSNW